MAYIGRGLDNGVRNQFVYAATQGQTAFTGADSDGKTLAMTDILYTDCYQNGVKLKPTTDYTVSSTTLTLISAASLNDVVDIVAFDIFGVPDTVPASTGGTFNGGITATTGTFTGNLASTSSGVITNSLITSSTNQYAEQLFQDGNAGYALQVRSDNAQSTGTGSFVLNDRDTGSFPVVIKEGNASNTLVLSGSTVGIKNTAPGNYLDGELTVGDSSKDQYINVVTGTGNAGGICFQDTTGTSIVGGLRYTHGDNVLGFWANGAERMRIDANGNFMVGGTSNDPISSGSSNLAVTSGFININKANNASAYIGRSGNDGSVVQFYKGTSNVGLINVNGSSTTYATSSDYRLKENVDYTWDATTRLKQLKPARFNFIADESNTLVDGFLAHEVSSIVPEAITGTKDEVDDNGDAVMQSIDQSKLVPLLVKALQEQQAVIELLTTRITALEAK